MMALRTCLVVLVICTNHIFSFVIKEKSFFNRGDNALIVPREVHALNRHCLVQRLKSNADIPEKTMVLLKGGGDFELYSSDTELVFQQDSYFQWTFGVEEPNFLGAIDLQTGKSYLFMPRLPDSYIVWMGRIHSTDDMKKKYEVDEVFYSDNITSVLQDFDPEIILTLYGVNTDSGLVTLEANFDGLKTFSVNNSILFPEITECRLIKNDIELEIMRYTTKITSEAHKEVMRKVRPGMKEYMLESIFLHYCYFHGAVRHVAYTTICASGENSAVLHYGHAGAPNDKTVVDGDMCLFDMGGKYYGYASDITCSFPANGTFTNDQKAIYEAVLAANRAVIKAIKPGVSWLAMHELAERTILEELIKVGILEGDIEEMINVNLAAVFMPHGLGHLLGLDVHDVGGYTKDSPPRPTRAGAKNLRTARNLLKGMVLTVEPGIYFIDPLIDTALTNTNQSKFIKVNEINHFRGSGGVRIEEVIAVTENGVEVMSDVPRTVQEIEAFMEEGRKQNVEMPKPITQKFTI